MRLVFWAVQVGCVKALCNQNQIICGSKMAHSVQLLCCWLADQGIGVRFIMALVVFMVRMFSCEQLT